MPQSDVEKTEIPNLLEQNSASLSIQIVQQQSVCKWLILKGVPEADPRVPNQIQFVIEIL